MKRVKVMLIAIAVLAIAGASLAFKAKFTPLPYCFVNAITTQLGGTYTCPVIGNPNTFQTTVTALTTSSSPLNICYTSAYTTTTGLGETITTCTLDLGTTTITAIPTTTGFTTVE